jgi:hypothetical protein
MARPKITGAQRDFTSGELDVGAKRADDAKPFLGGARQMSNYRILATRVLNNRPGKTAKFLATGRTEAVLMKPGSVFYLNFDGGTLNVFNSAGANVFTASGMPWTVATCQQVVWDVYLLNVYICFPGSRPQVLTWDGVSAWSLANYVATIAGLGQSRVPFYRISPKSVTMQPSTAAIGAGATLTFSSPIAVPGMVGTLMRYVDAQILITGYTDPTHLVGNIQQKILDAWLMGIGAVSGSIQVGDLVIGATSGAKGIVTNLIYSGGGTSPPTQGAAPVEIEVQYIVPGKFFGTGIPGVFGAPELLVGPYGAVQITSLPNGLPPQAISLWDDEVMNDFRGWPSGVRVDQNRVIFYNFPSVPNGISWSAIGSPFDLYVDQQIPTADGGMFELAPGKAQVLYVEPGAEGNEYIFTTIGIYYVPISINNPLKPGSVAFNLISRDGCANVQPRLLQEELIFINAGNLRPMVVAATGSYSRPYETREVGDLATHLFTGPVCIAAPTADSFFPERYAYILNADGSIVVGFYRLQNGLLVGNAGWIPWTGAGKPSWVSARLSEVLFTNVYNVAGGSGPVSVVETLDSFAILDCNLPVNNPPAVLAPPGGKGPLWFMPGVTVTLIDNGTVFMGTYQIDANGFIVPQFTGGENLNSPNLMAGQAWTSVLEPFVPMAPAGEARKQRMVKRRAVRVTAWTVHNTGFVFARLFGGPLTPTSPALGTIMNIRRITAYNMGDDATQPAPMREQTYDYFPLGLSWDARVAIIKDTPGPFTLVELGIEATV